jgi:hypothetical protein
VLAADGFEEQLARYVYERSEEARAVRVGEKETSEQAAIVARYAELFTREQHAALRGEAAAASPAARERLVRLRESCAGGIVAAELAVETDELENAILAHRLAFKGEIMPLRSAQARLAVLAGYADREELGRLTGDASALFNGRRLALLVQGEALEAELSADPDPVRRSSELKGVDLHELAQALAAASRGQDAVWADLSGLARKFAHVFELALMRRAGADARPGRAAPAADRGRSA